MKPIRKIISNIQSEFAGERATLCDYIRGDALLGKFFQPFIFEELLAIDIINSQKTCLGNVKGRQSNCLGLAPDRTP